MTRFRVKFLKARTDFELEAEINSHFFDCDSLSVSPLGMLAQTAEEALNGRCTTQFLCVGEYKACR